VEREPEKECKGVDDGEGVRTRDGDGGGCENEGWRRLY